MMSRSSEQKTIERIVVKAKKLHDLHVVNNINSTCYGGGVAEILSSLTLLMNAAGIRTGLRVIQGRPGTAGADSRRTRQGRHHAGSADLQGHQQAAAIMAQHRGLDGGSHATPPVR